jgi:hypothetical protein
MRRILVPAVISAFLILILQTDTIRSQNNGLPRIGNEFNRFISGLSLPDKLTICGEELPIDEPEVRERAEREFYLLLQKPGQVVLYLKRAARLFPMYEQKLKEAGLPDDLKYLSVAESALFQARSSAGAVGLWQFMKGTGKQMGLVIGPNVDERRHPEKSTDAALKFLAQGYKKHNSWALTLGGYNMGFTGIGNRMTQQYGTDYFDLYLNEETSRFVFRIAIIKELMSNPEKYGYVIPNHQLYKPHKTKTVKVASISSLSDWAVSQGTSYKYVKVLNPWLLTKKLPKHPDGKMWEVKIPA